MRDLESARQLWLTDRPLYEEFAQLLAGRLRAAVQPIGIWFEVEHRTKEIDSLIKKLLKKRNHYYGSLPDKVGARVTVRYLSDIPKVVEAVTKTFKYSKIDYKDPQFDTVGYLSIHIDKVCLKSEDAERRKFPANRFWAEVQIRTRAQHLWSEMSHDSIYKNDEEISMLAKDIKRRVHLMAGQLEVADQEFDRLAKEMPIKPAAELLRFLEPFYFFFTCKRPDYELSLDILEVLAPLYGTDINITKDLLRSFIERHRAFLNDLYSLKQRPGATNVSSLFFQPEALVIYERLKDDIVALRSAWTLHFPEKELESLASTFGIVAD